MKLTNKILVPRKGLVIYKSIIKNSNNYQDFIKYFNKKYEQIRNRYKKDLFSKRKNVIF